MTQQPSVVIVEDDQWLAEQYTRTLKRAGYAVHYAPHALAAIDVIDKVMPQAIVLDLLLTGITAMALLNELKSHEDLAKIPVVLVTNIADQLQLDDLQSYGVKRMLDKTSMQPEDIAFAVRSVVAT